jgi:hypothetical protein
VPVSLRVEVQNRLITTNSLCPFLSVFVRFLSISSFSVFEMGRNDFLDVKFRKLFRPLQVEGL